MVTNSTQPVEQVCSTEDDDARALLDLLVCPLCSRPLRASRTLQCGNSLCDACWDAASLDGGTRSCPFENCIKGRHSNNTAHDIVLVKIWAQIDLLTSAVCLEHKDDNARTFEDLIRQYQAGKVDATNDSAMSQSDNQTESNAEPISNEQEKIPIPEGLLSSISNELDCQICYSPLHDPLTSPCGHSFCRACMLRSIDHSPLCPTCRTAVPPPFANLYHAPRSAVITSLCLKFWPRIWEDRAKAIKNEDDFTEVFHSMDGMRLNPGITIPIFVCTLSFPYMPTFLHIFEPRYKLMIRRCMEADRRFGICLPKEAIQEDAVGEEENCPTAQYGTILRIHNVQFLDDGRSLVETRGEDRYRLERWGTLNGYMVGHVELLADDGTGGDAEEEESSSLLSAPSLGIDLSADDSDLTLDELLGKATEFIEQLRNGSAPWLLQRVELTHGEVPSDPTVFAFWVASLIPVDEDQKYLLLKARGVRTRLRIVVHWIQKLQTQWWFNGGCLVM